MAVVNSESGLMRQLYEAGRSIAQMRRLVRSIYGDARSRVEDGYSPSDIQVEMKARMDEVEDLADIVAADVTALSFQFQSSYDAAKQGGSNQLQIITDAYYDGAGSYSAHSVIQPKFEGVSWYHATDTAFKADDIIKIENSEDASNDGTYTVDDVANVAPSAINHVANGDFADGDYTGSDLVTDGHFTTDLGTWTGLNWAWDAGDGGKALHTAAPGNVQPLTKAAIVVVGKVYRVQYTVRDWTAGTVTPACGSTSGQACGANGTFTEWILCAGNTDLTFTPTETFDGSLDDISCYEAKWHLGAGGYFKTGDPTPTDLWVAASGTNASKAAGTAADLTQYHGSMVTGPTTAALYHLIFTVTMTAGTLTAKIASDTDTHLAVSASGTYNLVCRVSASHGVVFSAGATFAGSIDDVYLFPFRGICLRAILGADNNDDESMKITLYQR